MDMDMDTVAYVIFAAIVGGVTGATIAYLWFRREFNRKIDEVAIMAATPETARIFGAMAVDRMDPKGLLKVGRKLEP